LFLTILRVHSTHVAVPCRFLTATMTHGHASRIAGMRRTNDYPITCVTRRILGSGLSLPNQIATLGDSWPDPTFRLMNTPNWGSYSNSAYLLFPTPNPDTRHRPSTHSRVKESNWVEVPGKLIGQSSECRQCNACRELERSLPESLGDLSHDGI